MEAGAGRKLEVRVTDEDARKVLGLSGELDAGGASELLSACRQLTTTGSVYEIVLDLREVSFMDSAALRAVIDIERTARRGGIHVEVRSPPPGVVELMRTTGLRQQVALGPDPGHSPVLAGEHRVEMSLPRTLSATAEARGAVRDLAAGSRPERLSVLALLTSEVVTNAVIHSGLGLDDGEDVIKLVIQESARGVAVQVLDPGPGFDPQHPPPRPPERGGRGLLLVDHLAARWGAGFPPEALGWFSVWFEVDLGPGPA